jgi:Ca2+-dependent lipid-binding protein
LDDDSVLQIRVVEGRDLMPMDITGKSDPYVVMQLGKETFKTKYIAQELNPVWNEIFTFDVTTGREILDVKVYNHGEFGSDDFCGKFSLDLNEFRDQMPHDNWYSLVSDVPENQDLWHGKIRLGI